MPSNYTPDFVTPIGQTNFRQVRKRFGIKIDDRRRHMYLIGKTGMGKSTMLENMIVNDIRAGHGVAVVDPHGDLVEKILDFIPSNRVNDVIYFNPGDQEFPVAFNILETVQHSQRHLVASGMVGVFKKIWADSWGPRLEYVLRNAIMALLDYPGSTMLGIMRVLVDKTYRKKVIDKIEDPVVKSFWVDEYSKYPDKFQSEAIAPIQNKVGQFLSNPLIRNIVGQVSSTFDIREVIDGKKILLLNLAKGRIGEDTSGLLGAMMITKLQLAAMARIDLPETQRRDFFLYVDEFQNFATESFANILSEARKYRLNLIIAHQYIEQLDEKVAAAVFGNVGTMAVFRVGAADAEFLLKEFEPVFTEEDLVNLPKYNMYLKLMIDGVASNPFSATGLPPLRDDEKTGNREKIIKVSRERYALDRRVIEEKIARWAGGEREVPSEVITAERKRPAEFKTREERPPRGDARPAVSYGQVGAARKEHDKKGVQFKTNCDICGQDTVLSFIPDPNKPIYCKDCLRKKKAGEPLFAPSTPLRAPRGKPLRPSDVVPNLNISPLKAQLQSLASQKTVPSKEEMSLSEIFGEGALPNKTTTGQSTPPTQVSKTAVAAPETKTPVPEARIPAPVEIGAPRKKKKRRRGHKGQTDWSSSSSVTPSTPMTPKAPSTPSGTPPVAKAPSGQPPSDKALRTPNSNQASASAKTHNSSEPPRSSTDKQSGAISPGQKISF